MLRVARIGLAIALFAGATPTFAQSVAPNPLAACATTPRLARVTNDSVPDLAGIWDFSIDMSSAISTGTMALGHMDGAYAGALTPDATTTVVIRRLTLTRDSVQMAVASREGDVTFEGRILGTGGTLCGIVNYHKGLRFPMIATMRKRPGPA